jgi:hypothetical protein
MNCASDRRTPAYHLPMQETPRVTEHRPMHPDDYAAHLSWVIASRFHEMVRNRAFPEKTVRCHIVG